MADEHRHEVPRTIRLLLRSLGLWGKNGQLISYLLFEPVYIRALNDFGQDDIMKRADEISAFLAPEGFPAAPSP